MSQEISSLGLPLFALASATIGFKLYLISSAPPVTSKKENKTKEYTKNEVNSIVDKSDNVHLDIIVVNKEKSSQNIKQIIEDVNLPLEINHIDFRSFKEEDKALNFIRENCHHGNYEKFFDYYGDRYIPVEKI